MIVLDLQRASVSLTEADLSALLAAAAPESGPVRELSAKVSPSEVTIAGKYPVAFGLRVPFETGWLLRVAGPLVEAKLDRVEIAGIPGSVLRSGILGALKDAVASAGLPAGCVTMDQAKGTIALDAAKTAEAALAGVLGKVTAQAKVSFADVRLTAGRLELLAGEG